MNKCNDSHQPDYKIIYKGAKGSDYQPEWLVCAQCHEKRIFGTPEQIIEIIQI